MVEFSLARVGDFIPQLLPFIPVTVGLIVITFLIGSLLGGCLTWMQLSRDNVLVKIAETYIFMLRCTPPIVLLFLVFYGIPEFLKWWLEVDINHWPRSIFVVVTLVLLFSAMMAEVFKSAYLALPKGQEEAALSIGLTPWQTFYRIVLPQVFKLALPNMTNALLNLLKDAALAYTIGMVDIMGAANLLVGRNLGNYSLETYTAVAVIYWGISLVISVISQWMERSLAPRI
ncbi:amino acid ABC transporter permease [Streptococcus moroccensis]|uniref:L-cystine transport system permease protein n=1 Tax=Streptococcus moroccensis TaxID=1451356 RepID=A0ABT9YPD0_9STRE|nr:amino acid ABC transporter permease [Streptococcus moroccensis]MDQ0221859.1 L-cystine transport system permease protein [Streptococcus moroccensis]